MKLEICANSFQSAKNAEQSGAHRTELCSELSVGGITPSFGLIKQVKEKLSIEINVLIRPRSGDFVYDNSELEIMKRDIQICKELGCSGIVSGVLKDDNSLDLLNTKGLIEASRPLSFTFHRAFDCVTNPLATLDQLIDLGVDRVLTSGQESTAEEGIELLIELKEKANGRIVILPGSGINRNNAQMFKDSGFDEIHTSASKVLSNESLKHFGRNPQTVSNVDEINTIMKIIQNEV